MKYLISSFYKQIISEMTLKTGKITLFKNFSKRPGLSLEEQAKRQTLSKLSRF